MRQGLIVFAKELSDALRDRRTLLRLLIPAVLMGPLLLMALSGLIASLEERAEKREILAVGIEAAPTLQNYIERQTFTIKAAPADYEAGLRANKLLEPYAGAVLGKGALLVLIILFIQKRPRGLFALKGRAIEA